MFELLSIGEKFLTTLSQLGDVLISFRLTDFFGGLSSIPVVGDVANSVALLLGNPSLAEMLFGSFLLVIISFKLFKFFKNVVI